MKSGKPKAIPGFEYTRIYTLCADTHLTKTPFDRESNPGQKIKARV